MQSLLQKFRRITYSTAYLPEVDGLRFLALAMVVLLMHIPHYMDVKFYNGQLLASGYWRNVLLGGGMGVALFFMISGFILSLPFAQQYRKQGKKVGLRRYYLRRLTRLEPPYLILLVLLFLVQVLVLKTYTFGFLWPRLLASATYTHMLLYHSFSPILPVAWTLEVEVQFYLLAPLFCLLFRIRSALLRRTILLTVILVSALYWFNVWQMGTVFMYLHFFLSGLLLADLQVQGIRLIPGFKAGILAGGLALASIIFIDSFTSLTGYMIKLAGMFLLFHVVLTHPFWKKVFSIPVISIIGGMCYSVYLLHFAVLSFVGGLAGRYVSHWNPLVFSAVLVLFASCILFLSALYFLGVEKPFMKSRFGKQT
ncbi:MAG TPA: acyltransferase [Flavisolibacter sp.]|jgi:peptidoglycan/LPS O-acetylase OafA/YrhL|nr:acyltransferase [Flavisolibacter sp.]